ncbi:MAG TPA: hypothetical protein VG965_00115 [Patescibacteria group bacterium]|nr:hypothetical protein [Patescibacteria group bacterium]
MGRILVEGEYTVKELRKRLDDWSGFKGLPGIKVHRPKMEDRNRLESFKQKFGADGVEMQLKIENAIDGMVELVPNIVVKL